MLQPTPRRRSIFAVSRSPLVALLLSAVLPACNATGGRLAGAGRAGPQWKLAVQAYTFNHFTFFEAIDKAQAVGIRYIEAYPGQKLSPEEPGVVFDHNAPLCVLAKVKNKLDRAGVKLVNYGVVGLGKDEAASRKVFDFAKVMGLETIVSEPEAGSFDLLDRLTEEYGINVAIHNHPRPSPYWNPDAVLKAVEGHSRRIGACADIGHWMRSGITPLEAIKKLEGRIVSSHFKDLNEMGGGHDVVWGTGKAGVRAILAELERQGFHGVFSIEYEHNWLNSLPEVEASAKYFRSVTEELAKGAG
jgi:sugar phosphate isomerase/epimerase